MSNTQTSFSEPQVTRPVNLSELYPVIQEVLDSNGRFSMTITGSSMYPTILGGRDQVTLVRAPETLKKNDLPLYRRKSGQFVLHRIVAVEEDGTYTCCGDHQWELEKGIHPNQIIGLAVEFVRKGRHFTADNRHYVRWVRFWVWFLRGRKLWFSTEQRLRWVLHLPKAAVRRVFKRKKSAAK